MSERAQVVMQLVIVGVVLLAATFGMVTSVTGRPAAVAEHTIAPPDASLIASTLATPTPTPEPASPTPALVTLPPATPTPTPAPIELQPYTLNGRSYTGVVAPVGTTIVAPFDARVEYVAYQIIDGDFRAGTDVAGLPHWPYIRLLTGDRIMTYRPGALNTDTQVLVTASRVNEGDPLFRIVGTGTSSWKARYDATVGAQIIVSLETSNLTDLDAAPFIRAR